MMPSRPRLHLRTTLASLSATLAAFVVAQGCGGGDASVAGQRGGKDPLASGGSAGKVGTGGTGTSGGSTSTGGSGAQGSGATGGSSGIIVNNAGEAGQAGGGGAPNCGATALHAARPIVNMLLVVDKSSSMSGTAEFPKGRWTTLGDALTVALDNSKSRISFGLEFFPFADDPSATPDTCETPMSMDLLVPIGAGDQTAPQIEDAFTTYMPAGGTPTAAALAHALDYFKNGDGKNLPGTSYVLLATDGGPNCNADLTCDASTCTINLENPDAGSSSGCNGSCCDPKLDPNGNLNCLDEDASVAQVKALADAGVKTFVVGIPGSEFFGHTLDNLAAAGLETNPNAPPKYYQVTSSDGAQGLTDVLTSITSGLITSCRLQLTSTPKDPNYQGLLNVEIDGANVPQQGPDGWTVDTTTSPPTVVLAGQTCDYLEQHGAESVSITYGCPTVMVK